MENYISYKHHSLEMAETEYDESQDRRFKVTTINWTIATENGEKDYSQVHKNEYEMTLAELI
jgi:hypothetical protein